MVIELCEAGSVVVLDDFRRGNTAYLTDDGRAILTTRVESVQLEVSGQFDHDDRWVQ